MLCEETLIGDGYSIKKMTKRANFRQRIIRARRLRFLRHQAFIAIENPNNATVLNHPKKKTFIVTIYER